MLTIRESGESVSSDSGGGPANPEGSNRTTFFPHRAGMGSGRSRAGGAAIVEVTMRRGSYLLNLILHASSSPPFPSHIWITEYICMIN